MENLTDQKEKINSKGLYPSLEKKDKDGGEFLKFEEEVSCTSPLANEIPEGQAVQARLLPPVLATLAVSFGCFVHGSSVVYGSVAIEGMKGENSTTLGFEFSETQDSAWLIGIASIGMIFGSFLAPPISNYIGRKPTLIGGVGGVFGLAYTLFAAPTWLSLLYAARLLMGVGLGVSQSISTVYIAEISTPAMRGNLAVIPAMTGCLGVLSCQVLANFLDWRSLAVLFATLNIPFILTLVLVMPESPEYLISRDRTREAQQVLTNLRGKKWDVGQELKAIRVRISGDGTTKSKLTISDFFLPHIFKPVFIAFSLMFFFQCSGINVMLMFAPQVFAAVTNIDKFLASVFLGLALFVSNGVTLVVAGKWPRRLMFLISSFGCSLTLAVMGLSYKFKDETDNCRNSSEYRSGGINATDICSYNIEWLPVVNSMIFIFVFNLGYGSLVWMTAVEILPSNIRNWTNGLTVSWVGVLSFITSFTFPYIMEEAGGQGVFWMYSAISFCGFLFIAIFVPETRGKTEDQIKHNFFKSNDKSPEK